jgi:hypothetical protein
MDGEVRNLRAGVQEISGPSPERLAPGPGGPRRPLPQRLGLPEVIRAATHRALAARDQRLQDYPLWEEWRRQGREIQAAALARLDELLRGLERSVQAWGGQEA